MADAENLTDERLDYLAGEVDERTAKVVRAAETTWSAREALNGCFAGVELDNRIKGLAAAAEAQHLAVSELKTARAALAAAQGEG